jgi:hypothetical protein
MSVTWRALGLADIVRHIVGYHLNPVSVWKTRVWRPSYDWSRAYRYPLAQSYEGLQTLVFRKRRLGLSQETGVHNACR